jgi:branched-chain amino acid transport system substrate-binding protein
VNRIAAVLPLLRKLRPAALTAALAALAMAVVGCGGDQSRGGQVAGERLTVYSSLPLQGPHGSQSEAIVNGEKLALSQAGGKAGAFKINFAAVDDAKLDDPGAGWNVGRTSDNATKAVEDARTIAYLGDFDSGASAISIPITNEAGFVQVSPAASSVGLTKLVPGADKGEPDKYYPSGDRTFARVVPADDVQGSAAAAWAKELGARKVTVVDDKSVTGESLIAQFVNAGDDRGLAVARKSMDPRADNYRDLVREIAAGRPDLVYFGGGVESNGVRFWRDLEAGVPRARLMASARMISPSFYRGLRAGTGAERTLLVSATRDPSRLPPMGQRFLRDYRRQFGERADPYAAYGYATMSLLMDAIKRAGDRANQRDEIVQEVLDTGNFQSVLGGFSIDDNGDTSLEEVAGYRVRNGKLVFVKPLHGRARG